MIEFSLIDDTSTNFTNKIFCDSDKFIFIRAIEIHTPIRDLRNSRFVSLVKFSAIAMSPPQKNIVHQCCTIHVGDFIFLHLYLCKFGRELVYLGSVYAPDAYKYRQNFVLFFLLLFLLYSFAKHCKDGSTPIVLETQLNSNELQATKNCILRVF